MRCYWVLLGLALSIASPSLSSEQFSIPPVPEHLELPDCQLGAGCPIPYDHLSNQKREPFKFLGRAMDRTHPRWHQFEESIRDFSDVRDCLVERERRAESPNLLFIDWKKTKTHPVGTVCMFRIGSSLGHPELLRKWMAYHDFSLTSYHFERYSPYDAVVSFTGNWSAEEYRKRKPNWFIALTGLEVVNGVGRKISYDKNLRILDVAITGSSKFN